MQKSTWVRKIAGISLVFILIASVFASALTGLIHTGYVHASPQSVAEIIEAHHVEKVDVTVEGEQYAIVTLDCFINTTTLAIETPTYTPVKVYVDANWNPVSNEDTIRKIRLIDRARRLQSKGVLALHAKQMTESMGERFAIHQQILGLNLLLDACNVALVVALKAYCNKVYDLPMMIIHEASGLARKIMSRDPTYLVTLIVASDFSLAKNEFTEVRNIEGGGPITDYTVAHDYFEHYYGGLAYMEPAWHALDKTDEIDKSWAEEAASFCLGALGRFFGGTTAALLEAVDYLKAFDLMLGYTAESKAASSNVNNRIPWTLDSNGEYTRDLAARYLHEISVPDLTVTSTQVTPLSPKPGDTVSVTFTIKNKGNASSGSFANRVFLSIPPYKWHTDIPLGTFYMDSLNGGSSAPPNTMSVVIPRNVLPGNYYVTVYTDAFQVVDESEEMNNIGSTYPQMIAVTMPRDIDLVVSTLTAPSSLEPGETTSVSFTVKNLGSTPSGSFTNNVFLSTARGDPEIWIGDSSMGSLAPGVSQMATTDVTIPPELPSNQYYITVFADGLHSIYETNEGNNMYSTSSKIPIKTTASPAIAYSPSSIAFPTAIERGYNPPSQFLGIWNSGGGTLDWSVSDGATWLTLSPASGTCMNEVDTVVVSADISGMNAGSYSTTITISASGAPSKVVPVTLTISSPQYPDLYISSLYVDDSSPYTGQQINIQATVMNQGGNPSGTTKLKYYFSTNGISKEIYLGENTVSSVLVGSPTTVSRSLFIPDVSCGQAYIIAFVNPDNSITEENTSNNAASAAITVRVLDTESPQISYLKLQWGNDFKTGHEYTIVFGVSDNVGIDSLDFCYSTDDGNTWDLVVSNFVIGSNGLANGYRWTIPTDTPLTTEGRIKMIARDTSGNEVCHITDAFNIIDGTPPEVTVLSPKGGEVWDLGSEHEIRWNASSANEILALDIYLYYGDTAVFITRETINDGSYTWTLPASSTFVTGIGKIKIRVYDGNGNEAECWSEGYLSISDPSLPPPAPWAMPERVTTVPSGSSGQKDHASPRITVDENGIVHLVYKYTEDSVSTTPRVITQKILYRKLTGSSWSSPETVYSVTQETDGGLRGYHGICNLAIAVDSSGNPHIVWQDELSNPGVTSTNFNEVYYSCRTGGSWCAPINISNNSRVADFVWTAKSSLPEAKEGAAVAVVSGKIYVMGGDYRLSNYEYNPSSNVWTRKADLPYNGVYEGGAAVVNEKIYAVGNPFDYEVKVYNPANNTWSTGAEMPTPRTGISVAAVNGKIYAIGDWGAAGSRNEMYDPATNIWSTRADMPTSRGFAATAVVDNLIYVIGGRTSGGGIRNVVEVYDPASNSWSAKSAMPTARMGAAVGVINGTIYVIGGSDGYSYLKTVEVYYPARDIWTSLGRMSAPRSGAVGAVSGGKLYVIGGADTTGSLATVVEGTLAGVTDDNPTISVQPRIALDPSGNVHVVWRDGNSWNWNWTQNGMPNVYYREKDHSLGAWSTTLQLTANSASWPAIEADMAGNMHVVFTSGSGEIYYMTWNGMGWSPATEVGAGDNYLLDIISDAGGKLHVAWYNCFMDESDNFWQRILYSRYDGDNWSDAQEISDRIAGHYPSYPSVVADSLGRPHIIWEDSADGSVMYKRKSSLGLSDGIRLNLDSQYVSDASSDIAVSGNDCLHVVWCNYYNGHTEIFYNHADLSQDITPPRVALTAPSAGECLLTGSSYSISWNSLDDFATSTVSLEYTVDKGSHYDGITANISDTGSCLWIVPDIISDQVQIRINVCDTGGNIGSYTSDYLSISDGTSPDVSVTSPNGGEMWVAGSQHNIAWNATDNTQVTSVSILYSIDAGSSWTPLATNMSNSGSYLWTVPDKPASTYIVRVIALDSDSNQGEDISDGNFTVVSDNNPPNAPSNPVPANEANNTSADADLSWDGGDSDAGDTVTYDVYFGNTTDMMLVSCNQTDNTFDPGTLELETFYCWKVVATDSNGASASSPLWSFRTESGPVPDSPTGLIAEVVSDSQIDIQWADNSCNELGFRIERKIELTDIYSQICTVGRNVTWFSDTGLTEGVDYYYRVCAYSSSGDSSYSNEANATSLMRPVASFAMSSQGLSIGQVGDTIVFDGASSFDSDGMIDFWQWELGDGNATMGETVEHAYSSAGNYTVQLTVMDDEGLTDTVSQRIKIVAVGDVNEDCAINATDLVGEERCILGLDYPGPGADPNQDRDVSPTDITAIELIMAQSEPSNGSTTTAAVSIEAPDQVAQGDPLIVKVEIDNTTNFDACAFDLTFDNSILCVTDVTAGSISGYGIPVDMWSEITAGKVRVIENIPGTSGVSGSGYLVEIHFLALNESDTEETSPLDLSDITISNSDGDSVPIIASDGNVTVTQPLPRSMEGDVTMDGSVKASDSMFILQYLVGTRTLNEDQLRCADTTDDGQVSAVDAMHILQWLVDPDGSLGVLYKPLWQSPADSDLLQPDAG